MNMKWIKINMASSSSSSSPSLGVRGHGVPHDTDINATFLASLDPSLTRDQCEKPVEELRKNLLMKVSTLKKVTFQDLLLLGIPLLIARCLEQQGYLQQSVGHCMLLMLDMYHIYIAT